MQFGDYATLQDSASRADEGPPPTGWTAWLSPGILVRSNQFAPNDSGDNGGYLTAGMSTRNVEAYITLSTLSTTATAATAIIARANPTGAGFNGDGLWVQHTIAAGGDSFNIQTMVAGSFSTIFGPITGPDLVNGDKLGIRVIGNTVEAWVFTSGAWQVLGAADTTAVPGSSSQNKIGLYSTGDTAFRYDDLFAGSIVSESPAPQKRPPGLRVPGVFRRAPIATVRGFNPQVTPLYIDTAEGSIVLQGSAFDIKGYVDSRAGSVVLQGQAFDNRRLFDSRAGSIVLQGTRVDSLTFTDSRSGSIVLQGTRVDGFTLYDSRTGSVVLQGARIDNIRFDERGNGTIVLQGTETDTFTGGAAIPVTVEPEVLSAFIDRGWGRQDHGKEIW